MEGSGRRRQVTIKEKKKKKKKEGKKSPAKATPRAGERGIREGGTSLGHQI